jgi:putative transcriptional regulator
MTDELFHDLTTALTEAATFMQGQETQAVVHPGLDVRAIRQKTGLSREAFAEAYGLNPKTVQSWEQGRRNPTDAARSLLVLINANPEGVRQILAVA